MDSSRLDLPPDFDPRNYPPRSTGAPEDKTGVHVYGVQRRQGVTEFDIVEVLPQTEIHCWRCHKDANGDIHCVEVNCPPIHVES